MLLTTLLLLLLLLLILFVVVVKAIRVKARNTRHDNSKRIMIVVLGDIGHSPRMQYHARSLIGHGYHVDIIGYSAFQLLIDSPLVQCHYLVSPPRLPTGTPKLLFLLYAPFKILYQIFILIHTMLVLTPRPNTILIQNPPAIPLLAIARLVAYLRYSRLIIDWHNFGYTILGLNLGAQHPVVRLAEWYERIFGGHAYAHLCVTEAMATKLRNEWRIRGPIYTLYDRAPDQFHRLSIEDKHKLLLRLKLSNLFIAPSNTNTEMSTLMIDEDEKHKTLWTMTDAESSPIERSNRPALLVTATSWTADEDFDLLLEAISDYDQRVDMKSTPTTQLPPLVMMITGKGPLKEHYEAIIKAMPLRHVRIATVWLTIEDYPRLLGSADLGISLHASSSGLDLPMKVVDMFGCGLPVCALKFACIDELVLPNSTGLLFDTSTELADHLETLLTGFPQQQDQLQRMHNNITKAHQYRWTENWNHIALPLFTNE
ncbi:hypothetical protein BDF19DRAFT_439365 [Syncephalis fuscata]|nr:hypothetical protein BDF19DRAFT_439365 [Syncephalis fuscata]